MLLLLSPVSAGAAEPTARLSGPAAVGEAIDLPFDLYDGRIYLEVGVGSLPPRRFILDTGAQITHFTTELVREAGLRTMGRVGISGTGTARIKGEYVGGTVLKVGTLVLPVRRGIAAPAEALFGPVYQGSGRRFDGVLGYDLFARYAVEIDYAAGILRLAERGAPASGIVVPLRLLDRKPYFEGAVRFGGRSYPGLFHLDTGFGGALSLNGDFVAAQGLIAVAGPTLDAANRGVGGRTPALLARADSFAFGPATIERPITGLALVQGAGVRAGVAGRIGGDLLRRFTVTVDYRRKQVSLRANGSSGEPFEADMSGLSLVAVGADAGALAVERVAEGSPAAAAGVHPGDRLLAIDGVTPSSLDAARRLLRQDGVTRALDFQRGTGTLSVRLTLRRRI